MEDVRLVVGGQLVTLKIPLLSNSSFFFLYHTQTLFLIEFSFLKGYWACCVKSVGDFFFFLRSLYMLMLPNGARGVFFPLCMLNNASIDNL